MVYCYFVVVYGVYCSSDYDEVFFLMNLIKKINL